MISTRLNPRVLSPVISPSRHAGLGPDRFRIVLKRLSANEAACLNGFGGDRDAVLDVSREELAGLSSKARAAGQTELADALEALPENFERDRFTVPLPQGSLVAGTRTLLMGVVNVTPDSFSDGGAFFNSARAVDRALQMIDEGADILDIGGESTRPGARPVPIEEEIRRVLPVVEALAKASPTPISVDTYKADVARQAIAAGAQIVNDISGLRANPHMAPLVAETSAAVVVMHIKGTPRHMQDRPHYADLMDDVCCYLRESLRIAEEAGISPDKTIVDPGIGFGKTAAHNLEILDRLGELRSIGRPILVGTSRKSTIGKVLDAPVDGRLFGTAATVAVAIRNGAHIVRVHDVAQIADVARMTDAIGSWQATEETR